MPLNYLNEVDANGALGMIQRGMREVHVAIAMGTSQSVIADL